MNNAVYWQAVEDALLVSPVDRYGPLVGELDHRDPVDLTDPVELVTEAGEDETGLGFYVGESVRAVARVARAGGRPPAPR